MIDLLAAATSTASAPATLAAEASVPWQLWLLYIAAFGSLIAAAVFSGCEIGLYSLSKVRLRLRIARKDPNAILISEWFERPTYALEGLLIWQNIAGFIFTAIITAILSLWGFQELGQSIISTAFVLPMMLIFTEIMPKDLFHTHADRWMYRMVPMLKWLFRMITIVPLLPIVNALSRVSMWAVGANKNVPLPTGPRTEILTLFEESAATGVLTGTQQDLVQRALRLGRTSVREVMIPWNRVIGVPVGISQEGFRAMVKRYNVSRMPVLGNSMTEVLGIVDVLDALAPRAAGTGGTFRMADFVHPPMTLIGEQSVRSAITLMQRARRTIAVVMDRQGRSIGLVTMKDLIEELVGDLENW